MTIIQETDNEIAERFPIEIEEIGTDKKHMHLLCIAHPPMAPGRIMQMFKTIMALKIFRLKPAVRRVFWGRTLNGRVLSGDGGERPNWQTVERYVQRQGQSREDIRQLRLF